MYYDVGIPTYDVYKKSSLYCNYKSKIQFVKLYLKFFFFINRVKLALVFILENIS